MTAKDILSDQVIQVKRGRSVGFGFEPAFNSYFDFYLESKYFGESLLELQDVTFHLYLRKNLNDRNKSWRMPTIRQMRKKFGISNDKVYSMLDRLEKAHLLNKESGTRVGTVNTRNDYILSDPIPTLEEFLEVAVEGLFRLPLLANYKACSGNRNIDVPEIGTTHVPISGTDQQTLKDKQTSGEQVDPRLEELKFSIGEKTFNRFLNGAQIVEITEEFAVIGTSYSYAKDFIQNRLGEKIARLLNVASISCVVLPE